MQGYGVIKFPKLPVPMHAETSATVVKLLQECWPSLEAVPADVLALAIERMHRNPSA
jgi:hypothetical protein